VSANTEEEHGGYLHCRDRGDFSEELSETSFRKLNIS
jgi:hypothetical protein